MDFLETTKKIAILHFWCMSHSFIESHDYFRHIFLKVNIPELILKNTQTMLLNNCLIIVCNQLSMYSLDKQYQHMLHWKLKCNCRNKRHTFISYKIPLRKIKAQFYAHTTWNPHRLDLFNISQLGEPFREAISFQSE